MIIFTIILGAIFCFALGFHVGVKKSPTLQESLEDKIWKVKAFHRVFDVYENHEPNVIADKTALLRHRIQAEENDEYLSANQQENLIEVADALGDQLYIIFGTIAVHGLQDKIGDVFDEIHRSNMSKLENGKPVYRNDGKILKGSKYFRPNIKQILEKQ